MTHFKLLFGHAVRGGLIRESCFKCKSSEDIHFWLQRTRCLIFTLVHDSYYIWTKSTPLTISRAEENQSVLITVAECDIKVCNLNYIENCEKIQLGILQEQKIGRGADSQ